MRAKSIRTLAMTSAVCGGLVALGGCSGGGGGGDDVAVVVPPAPPPAMGAARFGAGFAALFAAAANSDPRDPVQSDIIPPSFTTDPLEVP